MCENQALKEKFNELDQIIAEYKDTRAPLIPVLHKAQKLFGYLPKDIQQYVAKGLGIPSAKVNGVVTFYSYFTEEPRGAHVIDVCMGTACFVRGAADILAKIEDKLGIRTGETTPDAKFTLQSLRCVGACGLAPIVIIDGKIHGRMTVEEVDGLLDSVKDKEEIKHV